MTISFELFLLTSTNKTPHDEELYHEAVAAREVGNMEEYHQLCKQLVLRRAPNMGGMYASGIGDVVAWATDGEQSSRDSNKLGQYLWQEPKTNLKELFPDLDVLDWFDEVRHSREWSLVWSMGSCPNCKKWIGSYGRVVHVPFLHGKCPACKKEVTIAFKTDVNVKPVIYHPEPYRNTLRKTSFIKRLMFWL